MNMVGYLKNPTSEELASGEEKQHLKNQSPTKLSLLNDPTDLCLPQLDDFPLSFSDSFLDFDSFSNWFMDGPKMTDDLWDGKVGFVEDKKGESGWVEKSIEMGVDEVCERIEVEKRVIPVEKLSENLGDMVEMQLREVRLDGPEDAYVPVVSSGNGGCNVTLVNDVEVGEIKGLKGAVTVNSCGNTSVGGGQDGTPNEIRTKSDEQDGSGSDMESEDEDSSSSSSSSPSSSSSSSSDDEDVDEGGQREDNNVTIIGKKKVLNEVCSSYIEVEEGEITLSDGDEMIAWTENEDAEDDGGEIGVVGPIRSKNELKVLPPVPSVNVSLQPHHQTLPVGTILSIMGLQVIVEGVEPHNPLNEGSILWITESRLHLGIVDEIFGPVKNPYYVVRYNSEGEVPNGIQQGTTISFVSEFASHVLSDKNLYKKGYDASGDNDEELSDDLEFSDDEKEAEYRRMLKMKRREHNESKPGNKKKEKKHFKSQAGKGNSNKLPTPTDTPVGDKLQVTENQHFALPIAKSLHRENCASSSGLVQGLPGGPIMVSPFPQGLQPPNLCAPNGIWSNGFPHQQQQNLVFPNGLPAHGIPWIQQNQPYQLYPAPLQATPRFQQQIGTFPGLPMGCNPFSGQLNFIGGPSVSTGPVRLDQNIFNPSQIGTVVPAQNVPLPQNVSEQVFQTSASQNIQNFKASAATSGKPQQFSRGRGGGRGAHNRGRGRNFGGRGRH